MSGVIKRENSSEGKEGSVVMEVTITICMAVILNIAFSKLGIQFLKILALRIMSKVLIKTYNCQEKNKIFMLYMEPT
jgi:low temperature requirement protein LtrA